jgi:uncharacterized integral membrane protein
MASRPTHAQKRSRSRLLWLLLLPFVLLLLPGMYNRDQPELAGIPFFYWFQIFCIILTATLTGILLMVTE